MIYSYKTKQVFGFFKLSSSAIQKKEVLILPDSSLILTLVKQKVPQKYFYGENILQLLEFYNNSNVWQNTGKFTLVHGRAQDSKVQTDLVSYSSPKANLSTYISLKTMKIWITFCLTAYSCDIDCFGVFIFNSPGEKDVGSQTV